MKVTCLCCSPPLTTYQSTWRQQLALTGKCFFLSLNVSNFITLSSCLPACLLLFINTITWKFRLCRIVSRHIVVANGIESYTAYHRRHLPNYLKFLSHLAFWPAISSPSLRLESFYNVSLLLLWNKCHSFIIDNGDVFFLCRINVMEAKLSYFFYDEYEVFFLNILFSFWKRFSKCMKCVKTN